MTTYAIGDIQGCNAPLLELTARIRTQTPNPQLIFLGDLINRGPQSLATLRHIRSLGPTARTVLGNHDLHLLAAAENIRKPHTSDTLYEILDAPDRDDLLDWIRHQPLAVFENNHLFVHAGVLPQWTAAQTMSLANEVETVLRGPHWVEFLHQMYGNTPAKWEDSLTGADRLRCIVNALTRVRFCTPDGTMDFSHKEGSPDNLPGYLPWYDLPDRKTADVTVVCGHWSTLGLVMRPDLLALDTGCVWGGKLTAVRLEDRALFQVACPQYRKPGQH